MKKYMYVRSGVEVLNDGNEKRKVIMFNEY